MGKISVKIALLLVLCLAFSACGNNETSSNETESNEIENESSSPESISIINDVNENSDRVWLLVDNQSDEDIFSKSSKVLYAFKPLEGEIQVIDFDDIYTKENKPVTLRGLDEAEDDDLWGFLLERAQKDFLSNKPTKIDNLKETIQTNEKNLETVKNDESKGYIFSLEETTPEEVEARQVVYKEMLEELENTNEYKPKNMNVKAYVETDSSGNNVIREQIQFGKTVWIDEEKEWSSPRTDYSSYDFTFIPTGDMTILSNEYTGYQGQAGEISLVTRKNESVSHVIFDTSKEESVSESEVSSY